MPYDIKKEADGYHVFNQQTGEDKGVSKTRAKAEAHMKALYANEPSKPSTSPGTMAAPMANGGKMALDDTYTPRPITHAYMGGRRYAVGGVLPPAMGAASLDTHGTETESIPQKDADLHGSVGGKTGLPATGSGATDAGLGAGIIAAVTDKVSNTNDKTRATKGDRRGTNPNDPGHFKRGGVLQKLAKKIHKGGLHESLGIPQGENIPEARIAAAAKKPGKVGKQARLAETFAAARK